MCIRDSKYPGYGAVSRKARIAKREYSEQMGEIISELKEKREEVEDEIAEIRSNFDAVLAKIGTLKNARNSLLADYDLFKQQIEKTCIRIVEKYRNANRAERDDEPESFKLTPALAFRNDFSALNSSFNADDELESVKSARAILDDSITEFYAEFAKKIESMDPLAKVLGR